MLWWGTGNHHQSGTRFMTEPGKLKLTRVASRSLAARYSRHKVQTPYKGPGMASFQVRTLGGAPVERQKQGRLKGERW